MQWLLIIGFFLSNLIITLIVVQIKIKQIKNSHSQLPEVREEMDKFMVALDENVGSYVAIMEQMRSDADSVMEKVDRKLRLLEKENAKIESARQIYNELAKQTTPDSAVVIPEFKSTYSSLGKHKSLVSAVINVQSATSKAHHEAEIEQLKGNSPQERTLAMTDDEDLLFGIELMGKQKKMPLKTPVQQVASLWREGKSEKEIAGELGLSLGEVELALELTGSRR